MRSGFEGCEEGTEVLGRADELGRHGYTAYTHG